MAKNNSDNPEISKALDGLLEQLLGETQPLSRVKKEFTAEQRTAFSELVSIYSGLVDGGMTPIPAAVALGTIIAASSK